MAYLRAKRVKGKSYYQIVEAYREGGKTHGRVVLHLGKDPANPPNLLKWWNYLGCPKIPFRPGIPAPFSKERPSLEYPCATVVDLNKFFTWRYTDEELGWLVEGLKFLTSQAPSDSS